MLDLSYTEEVQQAKAQGLPLVGLETAVVTHGLPFPTNLNIAQAMEDVIQEEGAVAATVGMLGGRLQVGMKPEDLQLLAQDGQVLKISRRDLAKAVLKKANGGTTVAGTLTALSAAGIKVFATGGIGGVHREPPFDISADLPTLAESPVVVVCAGAKAILNLPATLEVLETLSIPVVGFRTEEFPAFFSRESGLPVSVMVEDPAEAAVFAVTHWSVGLASAVLLVVPPPIADALPAAQMEDAVVQAVREADAQGISGQDLTPFLLSRISDLTGKASLQANIGLLLNNARIAAKVAVELRRISPSP